MPFEPVSTDNFFNERVHVAFVFPEVPEQVAGVQFKIKRILGVSCHLLTELGRGGGMQGPCCFPVSRSGLMHPQRL